MTTQDEVLEFLNKKIREEHGNRVSMQSIWSDAELDSFGTTMVLADMDGEYECFPRDWFSTIEWETLTINDIVERVVNESPKLQVS